MPVYRCNQCGLIAEELNQPPGTQIPCGKCQTTVTLLAATFFMERLMDRYLALRRELQALKQQEEELEAPEADAPPTIPLLLKDQMQSTLLLANEAQHKPLLDWFSARQIKTRPDFSLVDTTGFFDEAASIIGRQYTLLAGPIEQVRYAYRQNWSWVNIELGGRSPQEMHQIRSALRQLYSHTFFARFTYQKQKNAIGLVLQEAVAIRRFFEGGWLEWWAFMMLLEHCLDRGITFSCARGLLLEFRNEEVRELDLAFLLNGKQLVIVECKSGEFRPELAKYEKLRKTLGLHNDQFLICSPDLDENQAAGLNAMYGLTFVNLQTFGQHLARLSGLP